MCKLAAWQCAAVSSVLLNFIYWVISGDNISVLALLVGFLGWFVLSYFFVIFYRLYHDKK